MKTQTPDQGGLSRQSTRLSYRDTPLECSTRLQRRSRSGLNVSYKDQDETIEPPTDLGPTLEDRRQEVVQRYYDEVKQRALSLLAARQAGLQRAGETETGEATQVTTSMDGERLPTIEERRDDDQLSKQGTTTQGDSETKASDVAEDIEELEKEEAQGEENKGGAQSNGAEDGQHQAVEEGENGAAINGKESNGPTQDEGEERGVLRRESRDLDVQAMENDADDEFIQESSEDAEGPPQLSQDLTQALHEAAWEGDIDLLDDMLDLPGASMEVLWFGENLLMTAIRAGQAEVASFLIENGVNVHHEVPRFERKDDLQEEIDAKKAAYLQEQEELKAKKKKTKKKDKEKEMLEQMEKEKDEAQVKTPEAKLSNMLTDFECFMVTCRSMAVEFERAEITEIIDEVNGDLWPEELVPRKTREKRIKQDMMEKIKQREDWVLSEPEISEPEEEPEPLKERLRKKKALSRQTTTDQDRKSKMSVRTRRSTVQSEKDMSLNVSGEKHATGGLTDGLTVAGEDSTLFPTPSPHNSPVPAIHHSVQLPSSETKVPYRGTRSFLIRQSANLKYRQLSLDIPKGKPKRDFVKSRGSFMAESDLWNDNSGRSSQQHNSKSKDMRLYSSSGSDFYNDTQRFQRLRSNSTRKISPWQDDNQETLMHMLKRNKTHTHLSRAEADISKAKLGKENTFTLGEDKLGRSVSNTLLRSVSSIAFNDKAHESKRPDHSKNSHARKTGARSSSSHVLKRYKSEIIKTERPPQTSPTKLPQRNEMTQSMRNIHSSNHYNNLNNVRENAWLEKGSPVNLVQKYSRSKRYSPAGYLKGSHSRDQTDHYNQLSLHEKRKEKSLVVFDALVVA